MINRIMKTGVVAVALAASTLLAAPATAQDGFRSNRAVSEAQLRGGLNERFQNDRGRRADLRQNRRNDFGNRRHARHHNVRGHDVWRNDYGQTREEVKYLADKAIYACACQLEIDAYKYGYKEGAFRRTPHYEQIGPNRFIVKGTAKLFDGYDYSRQGYDCVVKRGKIKRASNLYPVKFDDHGRHNRRDRFNSFNSGFSFSFGNIW